MNRRRGVLRPAEGAFARQGHLSTGELRYRWTETGALDHYRYAHASYHLYGAFMRACGVLAGFV